ncbi:MAG: O-antigen ligase family protein [Actinomycetota bacterium]
MVTALCLVAVAGIAAAIPGPWTFLMAGIIVALLLVTVLPAAPARTMSRSGYLAVEVPVLALLASGLVFRLRGTEEILDNPLDTAGLFRVAFLGLALFLAAVGFINGRQSGIRSRPFRLYALYAATTLFGVAGSPVPLLTIFHAGELFITLFVFVAAVRSAGPEAPLRIEATIYWFQVILMGTVWLSIILFPAQAITPVNSPIPWQIQGVFPAVPSNGVGTLGAILALWSLGRFLSPVAERSSPRLSLGIAAAGFVTLVAAQYRTGYVAFAVGLFILLALRRRAVLAAFVLAAGVGLVLLGQGFAEEAEPLLLRGQSPQEASQLSSRLEWWSLAIPVWQESPLVGRGLLTATRFEVLGEIGREETSTIHSTWVEALVGTGVVGITFLAASFLVLLRRAIRCALAPAGRIVPLIVLTVVAIRSVTGTTFEASGRSLLILLVFALILDDSHTWVRSRATPTPAFSSPGASNPTGKANRAW